MGTTRRRLWLNSWTDKALLVSTSPSSHEADRIGSWLPLSQITVDARETAFNARFGEAPQIALIMGTVVTLSIPEWLAEKHRLTEDADLSGVTFTCPPKGHCAHGTPMNHACDDCAAEHRRATA